jgi:hypothetical protein
VLIDEPALRAAIAESKAEFLATPPKLATRVASQKVLEKLVPAVPALMGGSADLTTPMAPAPSITSPSRPRISAAITSTMACANTPWPRP